MLEKRLQEEIDRYRAIYKYAQKLMVEQEDLPPAPEGDLPPPPGGDLPPAPGGDLPPMDDTGGDLPPMDDMGGDLPPMDDMGGDLPPMDDMDTTEEIDITDLVNMTKSIKKDLDNRKDDSSGVLTKMDDVFTKLDDLEQKLAQMDSLMSRIENLGTKIDSMKPKTPIENLEMRSLDSYPFNEKPQEFFAKKQGEMRTAGKNEYVLTDEDVENFSPNEIKGTFNSYLQNKNQNQFK